MDEETYYTLLGIPETATTDDIKAAFRRQAREYHPDTLPEEIRARAVGRDAEEKFKQLKEAYEVLSDPAKRRQYDKQLAILRGKTRSQRSARQARPAAPKPPSGASTRSAPPKPPPPPPPTRPAGSPISTRGRRKGVRIWVVVAGVIGLVLLIRILSSPSGPDLPAPAPGQSTTSGPGPGIREVEAAGSDGAFARGRIKGPGGVDLFESVAEARTILDNRRSSGGNKPTQAARHLSEGEVVEILKITEGPYEGGSLKVRRANGEVGYVTGRVDVFEVYGDRGAIAWIHLTAPYEFECSVGAVDAQIAKYERFLVTHEKSTLAPLALATIGSLEGYLLQCRMSVEERRRRFTEMTAIYEKLASAYADAGLTAAARRVSEFLRRNETALCQPRVDHEVYWAWSDAKSELTSLLPKLDIHE
jgi:hypothetical protein